MKTFQFGSRGSGRGVVTGSSIHESHILPEEYDWLPPAGPAGVDQGRGQAASGAGSIAGTRARDAIVLMPYRRYLG
jgi:hypothetical protein